MDVRIYPIKGSNKVEFPKLHPHLPQPPFRMMMVAPSGSGKGVVLMNILRWYCNYDGNNPDTDIFKCVVWISPTIHNDKTCSSITDCDDSRYNIHTDVSKIESILTGLDEHQCKEANKNDHALLIIDDCIGLREVDQAIGHYITSCRHNRVSLLINSQYFKGFNPTLREQCNCCLFFKTHSDDEKKKIIESIGSSYPDFKKYYEECTGAPYGFIFVDKRNKRLYWKFERLLYP